MRQFHVLRYQPDLLQNCAAKGNLQAPYQEFFRAGKLCRHAGYRASALHSGGETFSFWHRVGKTTKRKGYRDGRILVRNHILPGIGGGLCNLANTIHRVVLVSPLTVTEFHKHSDALAPDEGPRVPFSSGTSVFYNNGDYRFKNEMDQTFQLLLWCDEDNLYAELRCERPLPCRYRIVEEGHHFQKEGGKYYRVSKVYKETLDAQTGQLLHRELVLDNHSEVMYDPALIPGVEKL